MKALFERVEALTPEQRNLFIEEVVMKTKTVLEHVADEPHPAKKAALLNIAYQSLNLIGLTNAANSDDEPTWTSTGDKVVAELWNDIADVMVNHANGSIVPIDVHDLPEDMVKRISDGTATEADREFVKDLMRKQQPDMPEEAEIEFAGFTTDGKTITPHAPESATAKGDEPGMGLYL